MIFFPKIITKIKIDNKNCDKIAETLIQNFESKKYKTLLVHTKVWAIKNLF